MSLLMAMKKRKVVNPAPMAASVIATSGAFQMTNIRAVSSPAAESINTDFLMSRDSTANIENTNTARINNDTASAIPIVLSDGDAGLVTGPGKH